MGKKLIYRELYELRRRLYQLGREEDARKVSTLLWAYKEPVEVDFDEGSPVVAKEPEVKQKEPKKKKKKWM